VQRYTTTTTATTAAERGGEKQERAQGPYISSQQRRVLARQTSYLSLSSGGVRRYPLREHAFSNSGSPRNRRQPFPAPGSVAKLSGLQLEAEKRAGQAAGSATRPITSAIVMAKAHESRAAAAATMRMRMLLLRDAHTHTHTHTPGGASSSWSCRNPTVSRELQELQGPAKCSGSLTSPHREKAL